MLQFNMLEAKTRLSQLVEAVESGKESEIILARNGKPVARIVPLEAVVDTSKRLGIAEGQFGDLGEEWFQEFQALDKVVWGDLYEEAASAPKVPKRVRSK